MGLLPGFVWVSRRAIWGSNESARNGPINWVYLVHGDCNSPSSLPSFLPGSCALLQGEDHGIISHGPWTSTFTLIKWLENSETMLLEMIVKAASCNSDSNSPQSLRRKGEWQLQFLPDFHSSSIFSPLSLFRGRSFSSIYANVIELETLERNH